MAVLLETTLGDVVIDLYTEERPRGETPTGPAPAGAATSFFPDEPFLSAPRRRPAEAFGLPVAATGLSEERAWVEKFS